jgi:hypothetical protein
MAHGDLRIKVNEQGTADAFLVLPVEITLSDNIKLTTGTWGDCTASTASTGLFGTTSYTQPAQPVQFSKISCLR